MNNEYKKKYLKYKKKYLKAKNIYGGMDMCVEPEAGPGDYVNAHIDLAGGLFFAISSSVFLHKFYNIAATFTLDSDHVLEFFNNNFDEMLTWHHVTDPTDFAFRETFPWNNKDCMIFKLRVILEEIKIVGIQKLLADECEKIGDLDTKMNINQSDVNIKKILKGKENPEYASLFFLAREKCGAIQSKIQETHPDITSKKGEKTDLGASVLDRTFLSKLIHSDKPVLTKILWELIFIILKNEPAKINKRISRFIIFFVIFNVGSPFGTTYDSFTINYLLNEAQKDGGDLPFGDLSPPTLLSHLSLECKKNEKVVELTSTIRLLETFNWEEWKSIQQLYFSHIFAEIFDDNSKIYIQQKLSEAEKQDKIIFVFEGFELIKTLIENQTNINSLLLTDIDIQTGDLLTNVQGKLPYQNLAKNIQSILEIMNNSLIQKDLTICSFTEPENYDKPKYEIAISIKNVIENLAQSGKMAKLNTIMKEFYKDKFKLNLDGMTGPKAFSFARKQVPIKIDQNENLAIIGLGINKLKTKYPIVEGESFDESNLREEYNEEYIDDSNLKFFADVMGQVEKPKMVTPLTIRSDGKGPPGGCHGGTTLREMPYDSGGGGVLRAG